MNIKRKDKIFIKFSVAIGTAIGASIVFLGAAKDGLDGADAVVKWVQEKTGIPATTVMTILMTMLVVLVLGILLILVKAILAKDSRSFTDPEEKRARELYLKWIKKDINNRLKSSIHHARYIDLKLQESYKLISARNYTFHKNSDGTDSMIQSIDDLIRAKPFSYLLLGAPGAGKTTTLLNCVSQSIEEAEAHENNNIPVFINLSKWGRKEGFSRLLTLAGAKKAVKDTNIASADFDKWLIKIISGIRRTGLTKDIVKYWLEEKHQITLFLDGLDEADEAVRSTIVDKINAFVNNYSAVSVLISSRIADYEALVNTSKIRLKLDGAVTIHPLTPEQIKDYLDAAQTPQLQDLLDNDEALKEMARSPLELSIMVLARDNPEFKKLLSLKTNSITTKRVALFDVYVQAMVQREELKRKKNPELHDSDFNEISVSEDRLSVLYKNLGWIARILCIKSISTYSPGRIYDYLSGNDSSNYKLPFNDAGLDDVSSKQQVRIVNKVILLLALGVLTLCYLKVYPVLILFLAIPVSFSRQLLNITDVVFENKKLEKIITYFLNWLVFAIAVPFLYWPVGNLIFSWAPLIWIIAIASGIIYLIISYEADDIELYELLGNLSRTPFWKHVVNLIVASLPLLFVWFNTETAWYQWFIIGLVAFLISVHNYVYESGKIWKILLYNLYAISAAVAGILFFKAQPGLNTILNMQLLMILVMQNGVFEYNQNNKHATFYFAIGVFLGTFSGALTGLFVSTVHMLAITGFLIIAFCLLGRITFGEQLYERGLSWLGSRILLSKFKLQRKIPFNYRGFLLYSTRALLLKKNKKEYEFIHRRIRDYFAIREYIPLLKKGSAGREYAIRTFSSLKDASCDVLLEMIDDHDKDVRTGCLIGLGEIGSAIAAKSLIEAAEKTSGELQDLAIDQIYKIRDIAAIPDLISILNNSPVNSMIFEAALVALTGNLNRLSVWENDAKMSEYLLNTSTLKYIDKIKDILFNKNDARKKADLELMIDECLTRKGSNLTHRYNLKKVFCKLTIEDLQACIANENFMVLQIAFRLLCRKGGVKIAVECILQKIGSNVFSTTDFKFTAADYKKMAPVLINIIKSNDERYLKATLLFLNWCPVPGIEDAILQAVKHYDDDLKLAALEALKHTAIKKSIPYILSALNEVEYRNTAKDLLYKLKPSVLKRLISDDKNIDQRDQLTLILLRKTKYWNTSFVIQLLDHGSSEVQNAAIYKLGQWEVEKASPMLWELFNKKDEKTLRALISTLAKLGDKSIIPVLPELFWQYTWLQPVILIALMDLGADREIIELYEAFIKEVDDFYEIDESLQLLFAEHHARTGRNKAALEILFPLATLRDDSLLKSSVGPVTASLDVDTVYKDIWTIKTKDIQGPFRTKLWERVVRRSVAEENGKISQLSRETILLLLNILDKEKVILETIFCYDAALAREIAIDFIQNSCKGIDTLLANKLLKTTDATLKMLLIIIIERFELNGYEVIKLLRSYLNEQQDDTITRLALKTLGQFKDDYSLKKFLFYLKSPNEKIVQAALKSINVLCKYKQIEIDELPDLVKQNSHLQILLMDPQYVPVLNQLNITEIQNLAGHENPDLRYLAAIYSGIMGHGKLIVLLNSLLDDLAPVNFANGYGHTTVSNGALFALNKIGTPTAKTYIDTWLQKNKP